ncbi:MAG: hypothetical protein IT450_20170 [Phycisphaerales bacterium]|nr:hypothetical protein [Phycisphaerales bacterium]
MDPARPAGRMAAIDASGTITEDVTCRRCAYNLRGLHYEGRCPECGTPVGRSLLGDLLQYSDPAWVKRVSDGLNLIIIGVVVGILLGCVLGIAGRGAGRSSNSIVQFAVSAVAGLIGFVGAWMMTERDPSGIGEDKDVNARKIVRFTLVLGLLATPLTLAEDAIEDPNLGLAIVLAAGVLSLIALVGEWYKFVYYEQLARRIPDEIVARRARVVRWGYVICLGAGVVGAGIVTATAGVGGGPGAAGALVALLPIIAILGIGFTIFGIITILLILRLRRLLIEQARAAAVNWNIPNDAVVRANPAAFK